MALCGAEGGGGGAGSPGQPLEEPPVLSSVDGLLEVTLEDRLAVVCVAGREVEVRVWNGTFVAPTLQVSPGDRVRVHLANYIGMPTNLHFHGLGVSPQPPADASEIEIANGTVYTYDLTVPADHAVGLFWYHAHPLHTSQFQIYNGMSGAFAVGSLAAAVPALAGLPQRVLCLRDIFLDANGTIPFPFVAPWLALTRLVNGQDRPSLVLAPGATEIWRIANVGAEIPYNLTWTPAGVVAYTLAVDGHLRTGLVAEPTATLLSPGGRLELLVRAPQLPPGVASATYTWASAAIDAGDLILPADLMTIVVRGPPAIAPGLPSLPAQTDLRPQPVTRNRTLVFSQNLALGQFYINGLVLDMDRVDVTVTLGDLERWTVVNNSSDLHSFHIHQLAFQVELVDGAPTPFQGYQDTILVRQIVQGVPGSVTLLLPFVSSTIVGTFFYHCHMLSHEDNGMMGIISVVPAAATPTPGSDAATFPVTVVAGIVSGALALVAALAAVLVFVALRGRRRGRSAADAADVPLHPIVPATETSSSEPAAEARRAGVPAAYLPLRADTDDGEVDLADILDP